MGFKATAPVNGLTEAFALEQPPRLINTDWGGFFKVTTSVSPFCEVDFLTVSVNKNNRLRQLLFLPASEVFKKGRGKSFFVVMSMAQAKLQA